MEEQEIIKKNKLIAEFMGHTVYPKTYNEKTKNWDYDKKWKGERCDYEPYQLLYHSSWDWIMPVIIKINKMDKMISINLWSEVPRTECKIYNWGLGEGQNEFECENPLEAIYQSVVIFIEYDNSKTAVAVTPNNTNTNSH